MGVSGNISSIAAADVMSVRAPKPFATGDAIGRAQNLRSRSVEDQEPLDLELVHGPRLSRQYIPAAPTFVP